MRRHFFVAGNLLKDLRELLKFAELNKIQPGHVRNPRRRLRIHRVELQRCSACVQHSNYAVWSLRICQFPEKP